MPALKQCKAGCQLPGAYMCIRDMRLNKSMNVPPSCKIEPVSYTHLTLPTILLV